MPYIILGITRIPLSPIAELPKIYFILFFFHAEAGGPERLPLGREGSPDGQEGQDASRHAHWSNQRDGSLTL